LVRFRTGDIIAIDHTDACACTRTGMRFRVIGRSDDMVVVRGLNIFPTMVSAVINEFDILSGDYRIILDQKPPYDHLNLQVELTTNQTDAADVQSQLEHAIKVKLGTTAKVTVLPAASFPLTEGKTNRVIRT
jgi:phenylacetate-CoA ligase